MESLSQITRYVGSEDIGFLKNLNENMSLAVYFMSFFIFL